MHLRSTASTLPVLLMCLLSACAYQPIAPNAVGSSIGVGDTVRVTMRDGQQQTLRVTGVSATELRAESSTIPIAQIAQLERREFNQPVLWVVVGVGVLAAAGGSSSSY